MSSALTYTSTWRWRAAVISSASPGLVGLNNDAPGTATLMHIAARDTLNFDWSITELALQPGDYIYVRSASDPTLRWRTFVVNGAAINNVSYISVPIATESLSAQGTEPIDDEVVYVGMAMAAWSPAGLPPNGGRESVWKWQTATTTAPVGNGEVAMNTSSPAAATNLWLHRSDVYNTSFATFLATLTAGWKVHVRPVADPFKVGYGMQFDVTGAAVAQASNNYTIPVVATGSPGGLEPLEDAEVYVGFVPPGVPGPAGPVVPLDSLTDVNAPSPADSSVLTWNNASQTWVAASPQVVNLNPLVLPDAVGVAYPALRFGAGDGSNGTSPNPYHYEWNLLNDTLRLFSNRQPAKALASFYRGAADVAEFTVQDWTLQASATDGYLRFFWGADRTAAEGYISQVGDFGVGRNLIVPGTATVTGRVQANDLYATGGYLYGNGNLVVTSNGGGYVDVNAYSGQACVQPGNAYGVGARPKTSITSYPLSGTYWERPLSIHRIGGAGNVGMGFADHTTGWTSGLQIHSDGTLYMGVLNGDNSGYIKCYASAFTVQSSRRFKAEVARLGARARQVLDRVEPVLYRDLQHELAFGADSTAPHPDGTPREAPLVEPRYRFGLVAEEVEAAAPELVDPSHLGPGIDLSGLVAVLWQAVRDLSSGLAAAEERLAALEA